MGVTLKLSAPAPADRTWMERAVAWFGARGGDPAPIVHVDGPLLAAELHPAAEPLILEASGDRVSLRAKTGTAGPGYHRHVCELVHALGDALSIAWEIDEDCDETGWLLHRDETALREAFLDWLGGACAQILELHNEGVRGFALSLPAGHVFEHAGVVATPMGPRDEAWLRGVVDDPENGIDVFPWWNEGQDGAYFLGLATARMWTDVRWRAPLDDDERSMLERIATWIERAHGLDASLPIPWREQSEMLELLQEESLRATRAHLKASQADSHGAPIGYRRQPVRVALSGGWSIRVPGELAERWEERGTWVAWDGKRSVWFTSFTVMTEDGRPSEDTATTLHSLPPLSGDEILELERDPLRGLASFREEERDGEIFHRLEAHAAQGPHAAIGTVVFVDAADREWALATWGSLARDGE